MTILRRYGSGLTLTDNGRTLEVDTSVVVPAVWFVLAGATNGQALVWSAANSRYEPTSIATLSLSSAYPSAVGTTAVIGVATTAARADHAHDWAGVAVQLAGTPVATRRTLNFGAGFGASDSSGVVTVSLTGAVETAFDHTSSVGWTSVNGSGTASITSAFALTMPASTASMDAGRATLSRSLSASVNPSAFRACIRIASFSGGDSNTQLGFMLRSSTLQNELRYVVLPSGALACGYAGGGWTSLANSGSGVVTLDGTLWLEVTFSHFIATLRFCQAPDTSNTAPPRGSLLWRTLHTSNLFSLWNACLTSEPWDTVSFILTTYGSGGGDISATANGLTLSSL